MTTLRRLHYDSGAIAIYDVDSAAIDDNPFTSPLSYISRLQFHSNLEYPYVIGAYTGSVTLSAQSNNTWTTESFTIAAHGRSGIPYVEGKLQISGGSWQAIAGSTPVSQLSGSATRPFFLRLVCLGADATNIYLKVQTVNNQTAAHPSQTISYEIYLLNTIL